MNRLLIPAILAALIMLAGPHAVLVIVFAVTAAFDGVMAALIIRRILAHLYPLEARP